MADSTDAPQQCQPTKLASITAPQITCDGRPNLHSNFSTLGYRKAVQRAVDYIHSGDVFQVNLSQRLMCPATDSAAGLYLRLRECAPATFAGFFDAGTWQIMSASPERYLQVQAGAVETRPIKGTRQQTQQPEADLFSGAELQASDKDRAENVMIVDLLRNDIGRVAGILVCVSG